jgi:hypothetical protein
MNIRFTSSLTPDDENRIAPVVLQAISTLLNALPIAYMIRIDTTDAEVYQISGSGLGSPQPIAAMPDERLNAWPFNGSTVRG